MTRRDLLEDEAEAQSLIEAVYAQAPFGIGYYDRDLRCKRVNERLADINGLPVDDHRGRHILEILPPPLGTDVAALYQRVLDDGERVSGIEHSGATRARAGEARHWRTSCCRVEDADGRVLGLLCIVEDITERVELSKRLLDSQDRLNKIVALTPNVSIQTYDREGRVLSMNRAAERVFGYTEQEALGRRLDELILDETAARDFEQTLIEIARTGGAVGPCELGFRHKGGTRGTLLSTVFPIPTAVGNVFVCMDIDITDLKRMQHERERLVEELRHAVEGRDEFLSIASHELRTPLTPLLLQLESLLSVLDRFPPGDGQRKACDKARQAIRHTVRLNELICTLLDVSRITQGRLALEPEEVDLAALCHECAERFSPQAARIGSKLTVEARGPCNGHWDRLRLDQVLTNLLSNALKFGKGQPIEVHLDGDGEAVRLTVHDHGIGIAPEAHARIFDRFERAVSTRHYGGLGLGLYITREIVEAHAGSITVESEPAKGSIFIVRLPCKPPFRARTR